MKERTGIIVWVSDTRAARGLDKYGTLHYISRKMRYAVLYVDAKRYDEVAAQLMRLPYVKRVERSLRGEIRTEYDTQVPDKTRFYSY